MGADAWIKADTIDDVLSLQTFHFGVGVQLVEVADTESQVGVGKELYGFCLG